MHSKNGFFVLENSIKKEIESLQIKKYSALVQTESFLIYDEESRGILVKGNR